jgi:hypothetical protein
MFTARTPSVASTIPCRPRRNNEIKQTDITTETLRKQRKPENRIQPQRRKGRQEMIQVEPAAVPNEREN